MNTGTKPNRPLIGILCLRRSTFLDAVVNLSGETYGNSYDKVVGTNNAIYYMLATVEDGRAIKFDRIHDLLLFDNADEKVAKNLRDTASYRMKDKQEIPQ
jgi:hypothetical protein